MTQNDRTLGTDEEECVTLVIMGEVSYMTDGMTGRQPFSDIIFYGLKVSLEKMEALWIGHYQTHE